MAVTEVAPFPEATVEWLRRAPEPYIRYTVDRYLDPSGADPSMLDDDPFIRVTIDALQGWRDVTLTRHDKADHPIHLLAMLADLGVTGETAGVRGVVESYLEAVDEDGFLPQPMLIPTHFGGSGAVEPNWMICDFAVLTYALARIAGTDERTVRMRRRLVELWNGDFFPCCSSIPGFKGPGSRSAPCPYANLLALRALVAGRSEGTDLVSQSESVQGAAQTLLDLWSDRRSRKPFLFAMGTDFGKVKFPFVWYNVLPTVRALRSVPGVADDGRLREMSAVLASSRDDDGRVTAQSVYRAYKGQEWAQKREPSRLLTVLVAQALSPATARREGNPVT